MPATFVIAQGGGPTAVINQTLVGAVLEAKKRHPGAKVLGARHGVRGIRDGDFVDLSAVPDAQLKLIAGTPSATLGSTRDKPDAAYCDVVLKGLKQAGADAFIYIGGNDTAGTQQILTDAAGGTMTFVHAPKTIDNDLVDNDHTPGFISAGEFVAAAFLSVDLDFRAKVDARLGGVARGESLHEVLDDHSRPLTVNAFPRSAFAQRRVEVVAKRHNVNPPRSFYRPSQSPT